jgi:hypothetical protein
MEDDSTRHGDSVRPPGWAEALLRVFLRSEVAETESGDLLEAYRDSVQPAQGRRRADFWYVRQVLGYAIRAIVMSRRNWILAGLSLCAVTFGLTVLRYPETNPGSHARVNFAAICAGFLFYACVAVIRSSPSGVENAAVLRVGSSWGVAIGVLWAAAYVFGNLVRPHGPGAQVALLLAVVAFLLPFVAGAQGAKKTGRIRAGMRAGFWSGFISGLMAFLALAVIGYILAFIPGLPGAETPAKDRIYTEAEFKRINVMDALGGALAHLFLIGGICGSVEGAAGGCAEVLLARAAHKLDRSIRA